MSLDLRTSNIDRLRLSSLLDGVSYLVLLGIAMPLKYMADMPMAVRIVGSLHGLFFLALCLFLLIALLRKQLSFGWCVIVFVCALIPLAPFFLDHKLREKK
jgi:integral membrane protein